MPEIAITVNGRNYRVTCGAGEEARLQALARSFDERIQALVRTVGQAGEAQLLLVTALMLADELDETRTELERVRAAPPPAAPPPDDTASRLLPNSSNAPNCGVQLPGSSGTTIPGANTYPLGAVPDGALVPLYGAHLREQATEDVSPTAEAAALHFFARASTAPFTQRATPAARAGLVCGS